MQANGHDQRGRFAKGNAGGPGRPRREREREYLDTLRDGVPLDAWQRVVARAVADAEAGEHKAREWLAKYLIGSPTDAGDAEDAGLTMEQRRAKLVAIIERLQAQQEPEAPNPQAVVREMLNEPEYLDYLRDKALTEAGERGVGRP